MTMVRRVGLQAVSEVGTPDGHPLLFLHGIGSSRAGFTAQLEYFGSTRWCLAPDAPGYADSDDDPTIGSLDDYVDHVVALLDGVGAERADIVGVSWGGVIATRVAATRPDRVGRLVLADTSRGSGLDPDRAAAMRARPEILTAEGNDAFARARAPRLLSPEAGVDLLDAVATDMATAIRLPGYAQAAAAMADTDHTPLLRTVAAETLVIVGEADVVCPPSEAAILTELIPDASLVVIPGAGHLANREKPTAFNQAVEAFLTRPQTFP